MPEETMYERLDEAESIMKKLVEKYPTKFSNVDCITVSWWSITNKEKPKSCRTIAKIMGLKPPVSLITDQRYIVVVYNSDWTQFNPAQKAIVVAHEISHIEGDGSLSKHDLEDFSSLIKKFGVGYINNTELPNIVEEDVQW